MDRIADRAECRNEQLSEMELKRRIFEKISKRMAELRGNETVARDLCAELNPDVIVIAGDQSLLFEPQNLRVTEWLRRRFGMENLWIRDRLRVHPCQRSEMIADLKAAGFEVVC